eukprot:TRINITY_DN667_c0_g1_i1.p1 TRINITY_DN667_c0_g1~~TRINITY_DN667_c0_g1_i1.p1  ORF type:complete len:1933 (+),score=528.40 TRINITY_DN667_c0_g1_i1:53-5800(+)
MAPADRLAAAAAHAAGPVGEKKKPELVPALYADGVDEEDPETAAHLRWMERKDRMGQDVFLLGPPGSYRRRLAFHFLERNGRETEHLVITRDTTEAELRQRREIVSGNRTVYTDSAPVRAAVHGRVLVLEGIEKAERNVLPTLNNLLENREVQLDDGRFLVAHDRYDGLAKELGAAELGRRGLVRVSPRFRVVALGLPVPPFAGAPLDPPLRSRFQARFIAPPSPIGLASYPRIAAFAQAVNLPPEPPRGRLPVLSADAAERVLRLLRLPATARPSAADAIRRAYPTQLLIADTAAQEGVRQLAKHFGLDGDEQPSPTTPVSVVVSQDGPEVVAAARFGEGTDKCEIRMPARERAQHVDAGYVWTPPLAKLREGVIQDLAVGHDICLVGGAGEGKSHFVRALAGEIGYHGMVEYVFLYGDMTARDLVQRRVTDADGSTGWAPSAAVRAAQEGALLVLDGLDRVPGELLCVLAPLLQDRQLTLHARAGSGGEELLLRHDRWLARGKSGIRVHPSFRVIALANPPTAKANWLSEELMGLFSWHMMPRADAVAQTAVLKALHPSLSADDVIRPLVGLAAALAKGDSQTRLSMRHLLRAAQAAAAGGAEGARERAGGCAARQLLLDALPRAHQEQLRAQLSSALDLTSEDAFVWASSSDGVRPGGDGTVLIGKVRCPVATPKRPERVPSVPFVEIGRHNAVLEALAKDLFERGERHIMLLGPQGVGKNRVTDFLLQTLRWEREYMQLHRDSTVQQLTAVPQLENGILTWKDSPVVVAAREGLCLMLDEADKAPLEVVILLKSLVEDGQLALADGRRIVRDPSPDHGPEVIPLHQDFRMFVLANRPGFPFLGNDLFRECGDVFSVFCFDNPDPASEAHLLNSIAPSVDADVVRRLVGSFAALRKHHQDGKLPYPYSTRELLHIVRHLHADSSSSVADGLSNVLSFDRLDNSAASLLKPVFERFGLPVADILSGAAESRGDVSPWERAAELLRIRVQLARRTSLHRAPAGQWHLGDATTSTARVQKARSTRLNIDQPVARPLQELKYARADRFSELLCSFGLPLPPRCTVVSAAAAHTGQLYFLTSSPCAVWACADPIGSSAEAVECHLVQWGGFGVYSSRQSGGCIVNGRRVHAGSSQLAWVPQVHGLAAHLPGDAAPFILFQHDVHTARQFRLPQLTGRTFTYVVPVLGASQTKAKEAFESGSCVIFVSPKEGKLLQVDVRVSAVREVAVPRSSDEWCSVTAQATPTGICVVLAGVRITLPSAPSPDAASAATIAQVSAAGGAPQPAALAATLMPHGGAPDVVTHDKLFAVGRSDGATCGVDALVPELAQSKASTAAFGQVLGGDGAVIARPVSKHVEITSVSDLARRWVPLPPPPAAHAELAPGIAVSVVADVEQLQNLCEMLPRKEVAAMAGKEALIRDIAKGTARVRFAGGAEAWLPLDALETTAMLAPADCTGYQSKEEGYITAFVTSGGQVSMYQCDEARLAAGLASFLRIRGAGQFVDAAKKALEASGKRVTAQALAEGVAGEAQAQQQAAAKLRREMKRDKSRDASGKPKHGEEDDKQHVGGNRWAGGSGGADTAGLGGKGGPYRLDKGHDVHQISDEAKKDISEEAKAAARKMGKEALEKRLQEIKMGTDEFELYRSLYTDVEQEVVALRAVLRGLEAAQRERIWLKGTEGELDDNRLVDARAGERNVFKRRADKRPRFGEAQLRPKRIAFVFDVSASMYRFNGVDGRLRASVATAVMLMEAFSGSEKQFEWAFYGHSGDSPAHVLVPFGKPPQHEADRLKVVQEMWARAQHCMSGDYTIEAIEGAPQFLTERAAANGPADEQLVFAFSDANLSRYSIPAARLDRALAKDPKTHSAVFFLASSDGEAEALTRQVSPGRAFVSVDLKKLPTLLKDVFTSSLLRSRSATESRL